MPSDAHVFEYGNGGSTLWLHDRGATVTVVEHDECWAEVFRAELPANCTVDFQPAQQEGSVASESTPGVFYDRYVNSIDTHPAESFDLIVVDGRVRVDCVRVAADKVKIGGIILLDDTDRSRYDPANALLKSWRRNVYMGVKPGGGDPVQTTTWTRTL